MAHGVPGAEPVGIKAHLGVSVIVEQHGEIPGVARVGLVRRVVVAVGIVKGVLPARGRAIGPLMEVEREKGPHHGGDSLGAIERQAPHLGADPGAPLRVVETHHPPDLGVLLTALYMGYGHGHAPGLVRHHHRFQFLSFSGLVYTMMNRYYGFI